MGLYSVEKNSIVAVLSIYRRPQYFKEQVESLLNQTILPMEIFIWINKHEDNVDFVETELEGILNSFHFEGFRVIKNDFNWKFHGRYSIAQMAQSEYVCVLDDDTIPGNQWFENCIKSMKLKNGLMGSIGEIYYITPENYVYMYKIEGWRSNNKVIKRVDVVGHSWFFRKEWLKFLWMEEPVTWDVCEDIQFSYCLQKYGGIYSYVPPQPVENLDLCGSLKGYEYGGDEVASYILYMDDWRGVESLRFKVYDEYIFQRGMELIHRNKEMTAEAITWNHEVIGNN
jgi:GT2 family glycosyltransferase